MHGAHSAAKANEMLARDQAARDPNVNLVIGIERRDLKLLA
jgi:hypothetical protein